MKRLFGTDGVRGVANHELTPEMAFRIGQATARWMAENGHPRRAVIVRDTRRSGPMLAAATLAGLCSQGVDVAVEGVAPSPAASFLVREGGYTVGVVVSASHNPPADNGIKLFGPDGRKMPDAEEARIEALMESEPETRPIGAEVGQVQMYSGGAAQYVRSLESRVPEGLEGMRVVVDGAHGAGAIMGPQVLRDLGAEVIAVGAEPDGMNINAEGGATKPAFVQAETVRHGADVGVAFDGDADRAIFSDEQGRLINGDRTMALWANHWLKADAGRPRKVVVTVMTNGGMARALERVGIELIRTPVGDKYVSQAISESGALVGGEQSGHIIFAEHAPTGDGLATMLEFLRVLKREGCSASRAMDLYAAWPQLMVNVGVADRATWNASEEVRAALAEGEAAVAGHGRVVARASGTQPMVRVMVECDEVSLRDEVTDRIVASLLQYAGGHVHGRVDLTHALGD